MTNHIDYLLEVYNQTHAWEEEEEEGEDKEEESTHTALPAPF